MLRATYLPTAKLGKTFLMCQPRPLFLLFSLFSIQHYNSTTNQCEKYPPSIPHRDSNSQPSDYQFPPLTTRPGLPPKLARLFRAFFGVNSTPLLLSNSTWTNVEQILIQLMAFTNFPMKNCITPNTTVTYNFIYSWTHQNPSVSDIGMKYLCYSVTNLP